MDEKTNLGSDDQADLHASVFFMPAISCRPADLGADCQQICTGADGVDYVIKDGSSGQSIELVPHCEWFCTQLSEAVHIAAPAARIIGMPDGTLVFGSRFEGGVLTPEDAKSWWYKPDLNHDAVINTLSHIYAFDQFVSNEDRHPGNYIIRDQNSGHAILAHDYSRAWVCNGFPLPPVPLVACATVDTQRLFRNNWKRPSINNEAVDHLLNKLSTIGRDKIRRIIDEHPRYWLQGSMRHAIIDWWKTADWLRRISDVAGGMSNGDCL